MNYASGTCYHCGADIGLHQFETLRCPRGGMEALMGQKQMWWSSTFDDSGLKRLSDAAPAMLEALEMFMNSFEMVNGKVTIYTQKHVDVIQLAQKAIEQARPSHLKPDQPCQSQPLE